MLTAFLPHGAACRNRPDRHVGKRKPSRLAAQREKACFKLQQVAARQLQNVLVRLVDGADRVIKKRGASLLNVIAKNMSDGFAVGEADHALRAGLESGKVLNVQPSGVHAITGKKDRSLPVKEGKAQGGMTGNREHIDHAAAQVDVAGVVGPMSDFEELFGRFELRWQKGDGHRGVMKRLHGTVPGNVVAVWVRVRDNQRNGRATVSGEPVVHCALQRGHKVAIARAGVEQQRAVFSKKQKQKWLLVIRAAGLAQKIQIRVVFMHLPLRHFHAPGATGLPLPGQVAGSDGATIGLGKLRATQAGGGCEDECNNTKANFHGEWTSQIDGS